MPDTTTTAQAHSAGTTDRMNGSRSVRGVNSNLHWLLDLGVDEMEIHITKGKAMVLVDHEPIIEEDGAAFLRRGVQSPGGTHLDLMGEVRPVTDDVLCGTYSGLLGGTAVVMHQYVHLQNGVPLRIVRIIIRVNGPATTISTIGAQDRMALRFLASALVSH